MTAKRKAKDATRPVMDENEWDFTKVRTDQLEACFCYEYGRQLTMQSPRLQEVLSDGG